MIFLTHNEIPTDITTPGQSKPVSDGNEVLHTPSISRTAD